MSKWLKSNSKSCSASWFVGVRVSADVRAAPVLNVCAMAAANSGVIFLQSTPKAATKTETDVISMHFVAFLNKPLKSLDRFALVLSLL